MQQFLPLFEKEIIKGKKLKLDLGGADPDIFHPNESAFN
jgi:hypothetical protein